MEIFWNIITYALIFLGVWCSIITIGTARIMHLAYSKRGYVRRADKIKLITLLVAMFGLGFVLFIYPGLIYAASSAVACLEVASLPVLYHLSELTIKNFRGLKKTLVVA